MSRLELVEKPDTPESFTETIEHYGATIPREGELVTWDTDHYRVTEVQHRIQLGTVVVHLRPRDQEDNDGE